MPNCIICNKQFKARNSVAALCGSAKCKRARRLELARASYHQRSAEKKALGLAVREPMFEKQTVFALDRCPWTSGAVVFEGRQPDPHLGF